MAGIATLVTQLDNGLASVGVVSALDHGNNITITWGTAEMVTSGATMTFTYDETDYTVAQGGTTGNIPYDMGVGGFTMAWSGTSVASGSYETYNMTVTGSVTGEGGQSTFAIDAWSVAGICFLGSEKVETD